MSSDTHRGNMEGARLVDAVLVVLLALILVLLAAPRFWPRARGGADQAPPLLERQVGSAPGLKP